MPLKSHTKFSTGTKFSTRIKIYMRTKFSVRVAVSLCQSLTLTPLYSRLRDPVNLLGACCPFAGSSLRRAALRDPVDTQDLCTRRTVNPDAVNKDWRAHTC